MTPHSYQLWKTNKVKALLSAKGVEPEVWEKTEFLPPHIRRRAHFSVFKSKAGLAIGYHKRRSNMVVDIETCLLLDPELENLKQQIAPFLDLITTPKIEYDLFVQKANNGFDVTLTGPVGPKKRPTLRMLEAAAELVQGSSIIRLSWRGRVKDEPEILIEREKPTVLFGAIRVVIPPLAFLQPSVAGESALTGAVMRHVPQSFNRGADLFSGCGTFTGALRIITNHIDAYEGDQNAIEALQAAIHENAHCRDLFSDPLMVNELNDYDVVIMDPPRAGGKAQSEMLAQSSVPMVVSVSCNPVTFARDALLLLGGGYQLKYLQIIDQFLWSDHVELVGVFQK